MHTPFTLIDVPVCAGWTEALAALAPYEGEQAVALRLTAADSRELWEGSRLTRFKAHLDERGHDVVAMVAVPGCDWREEETAAYALRLAHLLAYMLPAGGAGDIHWSTPAPADLGPIEKETAIRHMMRVVEGLVWLADELGATIRLHLEADAHELQTLGLPSLAARLGVSPNVAAKRLGDHLVIGEAASSSAA